jgi:PTS system galactitol-specific IIB component
MKVEKFLRENNVDCKVETCKVIEVPAKIRIHKPDLIVAATRLPEDLGCPSVSSASLLTGIGIEKTLNEILEKLKEE